MQSEEWREANARIAQAYDQVLYDPIEAGPAEAAGLLGAARLYGCGDAVRDVLDLGCGTGVLLAQIAPQTKGRLVGVDISASACALATERLATYGKRADIRCMDVMQAEPDSLGQFDLIYLVGVAYVTPEPVTQRLLQIIRASLKPGGVALITYYAGSLHVVRTQIHRMIRSACRTSDPVAQIAFGRRYLEALGARLSSGPEHLYQRSAIQVTTSVNDTIFFHEVFNDHFRVMVTSELEQALAPSGLRFLTYLPQGEHALEATSEMRGVTADGLDVQLGSYRYAVFGRSAADGPPNPSRPGILWSTKLTRTEPLAGFGTTVTYAGPGGQEIKASRPQTLAVLDALADGPLTWTELKASAADRLGRAGIDTPVDEAQAALDVNFLWRSQLAQVVADKVC